MGLDRLHADVEDVADFLVDLALGDELDDLALAMGERRRRRRLGRQEAVEQGLGDGAGKIGPADRQGVDRRQQMTLRVGLEDEAARARLEHLHDQLLAVVHGEDQYLHAREFTLEHDRQVERVQLGQ
jgi:hypothetical protein